MKQKSIVGWIVAAIVVILAIVLLINRQNVVKERNNFEVQKTELQKQFNGLMSDYEKLKVENEEFSQMLQEKDSVINANAEEIEKLMAKARTADSYYPLKKRYDQLEKEFLSYKETIDSLRKENDRLMEENEKMKEEILEEKTLKNQLQEENEELTTKVGLASILHARDISIVPMRIKSCGEKLKETKYASKLKQLHVSMTIDENRVAQPGTKTLYLRVIAPNNKVVVNPDSENMFEAEGTTLEYTAKQDIEFSGNSRNAKVIWNKTDTSELIKGFYRISIYCEGYEIGKARIELK